MEDIEPNSHHSSDSPTALFSSHYAGSAPTAPFYDSVMELEASATGPQYDVNPANNPNTLLKDTETFTTDDNTTPTVQQRRSHESFTASSPVDFVRVISPLPFAADGVYSNTESLFPDGEVLYPLDTDVSVFPLTSRITSASNMNIGDHEDIFSRAENDLNMAVGGGGPLVSNVPMNTDMGDVTMQGSEDTHPLLQSPTRSLLASPKLARHKDILLQSSGSSHRQKSSSSKNNSINMSGSSSSRGRKRVLSSPANNLREKSPRISRRARRRRNNDTGNSLFREDDRPIEIVSNTDSSDIDISDSSDSSTSSYYEKRQIRLHRHHNSNPHQSGRVRHAHHHHLKYVDHHNYHRQLSPSHDHDGPTAPDIQLDWLSSATSSDTGGSDNESSVEVVGETRRRRRASPVSVVDLTNETDEEISTLLTRTTNGSNGITLAHFSSSNDTSRDSSSPSIELGDSFGRGSLLRSLIPETLRLGGDDDTDTVDDGLVSPPLQLSDDFGRGALLRSLISDEDTDVNNDGGHTPEEHLRYYPRERLEMPPVLDTQGSVTAAGAVSSAAAACCTVRNSLGAAGLSSAGASSAVYPSSGTTTNRLATASSWHSSVTGGNSNSATSPVQTLANSMCSCSHNKVGATAATTSGSGSNTTSTSTGTGTDTGGSTGGVGFPFASPPGPSVPPADWEIAISPRRARSLSTSTRQNHRFDHLTPLSPLSSSNATATNNDGLAYYYPGGAGHNNNNSSNIHTDDIEPRTSTAGHQHNSYYNTSFNNRDRSVLTTQPSGFCPPQPPPPPPPITLPSTVHPLLSGSLDPTPASLSADDVLPSIISPRIEIPAPSDHHHQHHLHHLRHHPQQPPQPQPPQLRPYGDTLHSVSRLPLHHQRLWVAQQRSAEMNRRRLDPGFFYPSSVQRPSHHLPSITRNPMLLTPNNNNNNNNNAAFNESIIATADDDTHNNIGFSRNFIEQRRYLEEHIRGPVEQQLQQQQQQMPPPHDREGLLITRNDNNNSNNNAYPRHQAPTSSTLNSNNSSNNSNPDNGIVSAFLAHQARQQLPDHHHHPPPPPPPPPPPSSYPPPPPPDRDIDDAMLDELIGSRRISLNGPINIVIHSTP